MIFHSLFSRHDRAIAMSGQVQRLMAIMGVAFALHEHMHHRGLGACSPTKTESVSGAF